MPVARSLADTPPCSASRCAWLSASACVRARARAGVSPSACAQTEANKIIMQYLCWRASHSAGKLGKKMRFSEEALAAAGQLATGGTEGLDDLPRNFALNLSSGLKCTAYYRKKKKKRNANGGMKDSELLGLGRFLELLATNDDVKDDFDCACLAIEQDLLASFSATSCSKRIADSLA